MHAIESGVAGNLGMNSMGGVAGNLSMNSMGQSLVVRAIESGVACYAVGGGNRAIDVVIGVVKRTKHKGAGAGHVDPAATSQIK